MNSVSLASNIKIPACEWSFLVTKSCCLSLQLLPGLQSVNICDYLLFYIKCSFACGKGATNHTLAGSFVQTASIRRKIHLYHIHFFFFWGEGNYFFFFFELTLCMFRNIPCNPGCLLYYLPSAGITGLLHNVKLCIYSLITKLIL